MCFFQKAVKTGGVMSARAVMLMINVLVCFWLLVPETILTAFSGGFQ